jgi:hypothetical protein
MAHRSYRCRPPGTSGTRRVGVFQGFLASPDCLTGHQVRSPFNAAIVSLVTIELTALAKKLLLVRDGLDRNRQLVIHVRRAY